MMEELSITDALSKGAWSTRLAAIRETRLAKVVATLPTLIAVLRQEGMRKETVHQSVWKTMGACLKSGFVTTAMTVLVFLIAWVLLLLVALVGLIAVALAIELATGFSEETHKMLFENPALDSTMSELLGYSFLLLVNAAFLFRWYLFGRHLVLRELHWKKGLILFAIILSAALTLGWCMGAVEDMRSGEVPVIAGLLMWALLASLIGNFAADAVRAYDVEEGGFLGSVTTEAGQSAALGWGAILWNAAYGHVTKLRRLDDPALCRSLFSRHALLAVDEITAGVAPSAPCAICPTCLVRFSCYDDHGLNARYYRCRSCGRIYDGISELTGVHTLVAVLDRKCQERTQFRNGIGFVNLLRRETLCDFDRVHIQDATEEEVERYVMAVKNDCDELRQERYGKIRCDIQAGCSLSEHSRSLLRATFGEVRNA